MSSSRFIRRRPSRSSASKPAPTVASRLIPKTTSSRATWYFTQPVSRRGGGRGTFSRLVPTRAARGRAVHTIRGESVSTGLVVTQRSCHRFKSFPRNLCTEKFRCLTSRLGCGVLTAFDEEGHVDNLGASVF
jgi:hypothetical protein